MNHQHPISVVLFAFLIALLSGTACVYESDHLSAIKCSVDGERQGDRVCRDNLWIYDPLDAGMTDRDDVNDPLDTAQPPLDTDLLPQDVDTPPEDTGPDIHDTSPTDTELADTSANDPDIKDPDVNEPDVNEPDVKEPLLANDEPCSQHEQCISDYCDTDSETCQDDLCHNQQLDPGETDIDCGGNCEKQCSGYLQVAAGGWHTCALRADNSVMCWGHPNQRIGMPSSDEKFKQLSAGDRFVCGVLLDAPPVNDPRQSNVRCWGQLDDYDAPNHNDYGIFTTPPHKTFDTINAGQEHICGITEGDRDLHCWGRDDEHRTNPSNSDAPDAPPKERLNYYNWTQVHSGSAHSCAVAEGDIFRCWGSQANNRRNLGQPKDQPIFKTMVAGNLHTCGITKQNVIRCYSDKSGDAIRNDIPTGIVKEIDSRTSYACIIKEDDGSLACWGNNHKGRVKSAPKTGQYKDISTGWEHACALSDAGVITCWGNTDNARYPADFRVQ